MSYEQFKGYARQHAAEQAAAPVSGWARAAWEAAIAAGTFHGTAPQAGLTREQAAVVLGRCSGLVQAGQPPH